MATENGHPSVWELERDQHGLVSEDQLHALGFTESAIRHRCAKGRLHRKYCGVYAVGRPELTRKGEWMAAVLACGEGAALSHMDAAALHGIAPDLPGPIHVSVPYPANPRPGEAVRVHRRKTAVEAAAYERFPATTPTQTIVDCAVRQPRKRVEAIVNEADARGLVRSDALRAALDGLDGQPGVARLRAILDPETFVLTQSELERMAVPIFRRAGLGKPDTQRHLDGHRVDFWFADLGLVVEADSLRYHRTAIRQAADARRGQDHAAAGRVPVRVTHDQIAHEGNEVEERLRQVAARLRRPERTPGPARAP